jgi:hypothetical protein
MICRSKLPTHVEKKINLMKINLAVRECFIDTAVMPESIRQFMRCLNHAPDYLVITREISAPESFR